MVVAAQQQQQQQQQRAEHWVWLPLNVTLNGLLYSRTSPAPCCCRCCCPLPAVVLLNDTGLFELLFDDVHVMDFVGALEYEPGGWALYCTVLQRGSSHACLVVVGALECELGELRGILPAVGQQEQQQQLQAPLCVGQPGCPPAPSTISR